MYLSFFFKRKIPYSFDNIFANSNNLRDLIGYMNQLETKSIPYTVYVVRPMTERSSGLMDFCIVTNIHNMDLNREIKEKEDVAS